MLNSVRSPSRVRMSPQERRRQLVGIGLRKFVEQPVQDLSLDEVAAEAGVSRGLLFHYFPSKTDFHRAVVEAAWRRVGRNVTPDEDAVGPAAVRQVVERFLLQVERRRETYVALVLGQAPIARAADDADAAESAVGGLREQLAALVVAAADLPDDALPATHGWVAYLEDRALQWSALPEAAREPKHRSWVLRWLPQRPPEHPTREDPYLLGYPLRMLDALRLWTRRRWVAAAAASVVTALVVALPTAMIPTPVFGREIPTTWWAWPVLAVTSVLSGLLFATYVREPGDPASGEASINRGGAAGGLLAFFAVGCPVCNKLALIALGYTGALQWFAPVQPFLGAAAIGLLLWALRARLQGQLACAAVPPPNRTPEDTRLPV